jgi:signal transduction histidine kinase
MPRRPSLRLRVAAAFAGLGALLSLLLTAGIWYAAHDVSRRLMDQTLKAELEDYMARRARNPLSLPPDSASLRGYLVPAGAPKAELPPPLRGLALGQHEVRIEAVPYRVAIAEQQGDRYLILFNEERQQRRERRFLGYLASGGLIMTLLAAAGGLWLAGRVIAPVTEFAGAVRAARPEDPPRLARRYPGDDEIGELARDFDQYLSRIAAFLERERAFAADASHELRTPLAVIRGAAEVLTEDPALSPAQRERVARITRAAAQMSELIAALLLLAREEDDPVEDPCDAVQIVRDCIERHLPLARQRRTDLGLEAPVPVTLPVPAALFAIVVANLVHNAVAHTSGGSVTVRLEPGGLTVADTGVGIRDGEIGRVFERYYRGEGSSGAGIGLSLVKRVCDRLGWQITLAPGEGGGTLASLRFPD